MDCKKLLDSEISDRISFWGFWMTCVIVVLHSGQGWATAASAAEIRYSGYVNGIVSVLAKLAMNYFFAVSGFLFFLNLDIHTWLAKLGKRVITLLVPYLLWQAIAVAYRSIWGWNWSVGELLRKTFLFECWPPDGPLWYLVAVFMLMTLSPLVIWAFKHRWGVCVVMVLMYFVYWMAEIKVPGVVKFRGYGLVARTLQYMPSYVVGAFYGSCVNNDTRAVNMKPAAMWLLGGLLIDVGYKGFFVSTVLWIAPLLFLYSMPVCKGLMALGLHKLSFLIYAVHQPVIGQPINCLRSWVNSEIPSRLLNNLGGRFCGLLVALAVAVVIRLILRKLSPKFLKLLTGGRA